MTTFYRRLPKFNYLAPGTLDEALSRLSQHKGKAKVIAGGTSYSFTAQTARVGVDMETGKIIVTDDPDGPFGAKETAEGSIVSTPPAVVSAIHDATGIWFKELPVTPEKVVKALKEKK